MDYKRNVSAQALGRAIYIVTGVAVYVFVARFLGPEILGGYAYAVTVITVATGFADLSTTAILGRDLVQQEQRRPEFVANYVMMRMVLAAVVGLGLAAFSLFAAPLELREVLLVAAGLLPLIAARYFDPIFQVENRPWQAFYLATVSSLIWMISTYAGATRGSAPLFWTLIAHAVSGAAYGAIGLALTWILIRPRLRLLRWNIVKSIGLAAAPLAIGSIFNILTTRADVFFLAALRSTADVGVYNAAFRFLDLGMAVIITVTAPLLPIFAKLAGSDRPELERVFRSLTAFVATWCLLLAVVAPLISPLVIQLCYGTAYAAAADILDLLAWRFFLALMNVWFLGLLMNLRSIRFVSWNSALAMVVNLGLNFVLIPDLGGVGAGLSGIASEATQVLVQVGILLRMGGRRYLSPRLWVTLLLAAGAAGSLVHLPTGLASGWVLLAATALFVLIVRLGGKLPENPLRRLAMLKSSLR